MIARQESQPGSESGWIERLNLEALTPELPEVRPGSGQPAQPVHQDTDPDTPLGCVYKSLDEAVADLIPTKNVALEIE